MDDSLTPGEPPDGTDPTASESLDRKLDHVVEEWRRETRIAKAEQERLSQEWQRSFDDRFTLWNSSHTSARCAGCCSLLAVSGLACVGLGLVTVTQVWRARG